MLYYTGCTVNNCWAHYSSDPQLNILFLKLEWEIIAGETTPTAALSGVTHQSRANSIDCIYNFGHCFSLDISRRRRKASSFGRQSSSVADDCPSPLLLLEVYDVNDWGRQRSVGYGFAHFPILAGCHSVHVQTWRPHNKGKDACQQLRENFLGLAPQIENLSYVGIPPNEANNVWFPITRVCK